MKIKIFAILILIVGIAFTQSALSRSDGQTRSQNLFIDQNDGVFNASVTIEGPHHEIHEGNHFLWESGVAMASGDTTLLIFDISSSTKAPHMLYEIYGLTAYTLDILVGGSYIRAPDAVIPFNSNQRSSTVSVMDTVFIVYNDSTLISRYGTSIFPNGPIGVGATQRLGTTVSRDNEIIWGLDSLVIFKITSDAASNKVSWIIPWYEHTSVE